MLEDEGDGAIHPQNGDGGPERTPAPEMFATPATAHTLAIRAARITGRPGTRGVVADSLGDSEALLWFP